MFEDNLTDESKAELNNFARGSGLRTSPMHLKILESFESANGQRESLRKSIRQLKTMIDELENRPRDSSFDQELEELHSERNALASVLRSINNKNMFNFLSDEGLLPNYAFPESGVELRAVLYRRERPDGHENRAYVRDFMREGESLTLIK